MNGSRWPGALRGRRGDRRGFSTLDLLLAVAMMGLAIAATSGMFVASKGHIVMKGREVETTQAARAAMDMLVRDLRLGGACLPVTGDFISLEGIDNGDQDEITTRTGLTRADLSCVRTASTEALSPSDVVLEVESTDGFEAGMRAYLRHPNGAGEYVTIAGLASPSALLIEGNLTTDYPPTSGVYAVDERRFYLNWFENAKGETVPELMVQIGVDEPTSFAVGIEKLDLRYQLRANCNPDCQVVDLPASPEQWQTVEQILIELTARSELPGPDGVYFRRVVDLGVKPRNILPR